MADESVLVLMKVPGIEGNSTLVGFDPEPGETHEGWIPLSGCTFKMERNATGTEDPEEEVSEEQQRVPVKVEKMTVTRSADSTTADLVGWLANESDGRKKDDVLIDYVARSGRYFLRYELNGADLVSCELSVDDEGNVQETFQLTYTTLTIYQRPINEQGVVDTGSKGMVEFDVSELAQ